MTQKSCNPFGHTRLPRYARGRRGVVTPRHGVWVFADTAGNGLGRKPAALLHACASTRASCGATTRRRATRVYIDLWDDHLEPA